MKNLKTDPFSAFANLTNDETELATGALLIAQSEYPDLNIAAYRGQLDTMADTVRERLQDAPLPEQQIAELNRYLFEEKRFTGNTEDYYALGNNFLNVVLEKKRGIPITLAVVYIEVGRRAGLPLVGVNFPSHFLVKYQREHLDILLDVFDKGIFMDEDRLRAKLRTTFGEDVPLAPSMLTEATDKEILARILRNLTHAYTQLEQYDKALTANERITWLVPDAAGDYRTLGYLYYKKHAYGESLTAFETYLRLAGENTRCRIGRAKYTKSPETTGASELSVVSSLENLMSYRKEAPKSMLTKTQINAEKLNPDSPFFKNALAPTRDEITLLSVLDNLGKLPADFNGDLFVPLLMHANPKVRTLAVKNVGKLKNERFLTDVSQFAANESNTFARREAISAIGRMRSEKAIPILTSYLTDTDPKVILQSVRALLYFKERPEVQTALDSLREHPNELIREHLASEIDNKKSRRQNGKKDPHHPSSPDALKNVIVYADVQEALKLIPDESIHLTFTSPPYYNARDYTIYQSYDAYLDFLTAIFEEIHRITKEGRFFVLNTSPVIVPRISRAHSSKRYAIPYDMHPRLTDIGWEFIDDIVWTKPDYAAKNRNGGFFQHRKPLGYKANSVTESVMVYRKKTDKLIDWNIRQYNEETVEASKVIGDYEKTNLWHINPATDKVSPCSFSI